MYFSLKQEIYNYMRLLLYKLFVIENSVLSSIPTIIVDNSKCILLYCYKENLFDYYNVILEGTPFQLCLKETREVFVAKTKV